MGSPKTKNNEMVTPEDPRDEHEASTVVIDINKFRKELDSVKNEIAANIPVDIEFNVNTNNNSDVDGPEDSTEILPPHPMMKSEVGLNLDSLDEDVSLDDLSLSQKIATKTILFDFKSHKLSELHSGYESEDFQFVAIQELSELNKELKSNQELIIIFYYNQAPKAINALMKQLNSKFTHVKTMIIADNLSDQKANAHQKTASGAKVYLSTPSSFDKVEKKLLGLVTSSSVKEQDET